MKRPQLILRSLVLLIAAASFAAAQQGAAHHDQPANNAARIVFDEEAMSIVPPAFFTRLPNSPAFTGDPGKFGNGAYLILSEPVTLELKTAADGDAFERMMKTPAYQNTVAEHYVKGMGTETFKSINIDRTDCVTINSLPTIKVDLSMTLGGEPVRSTMLVFVNRKTAKAYYVAWFSTTAHFDDVTQAIKPAIESIEYR